MTPWSPHVYRQVAMEAGAEPATATNAIEQARRVQDHGLPAILTLKHLALQVHVPYMHLRGLVERRIEMPYRVFQIKKRNGGKRVICVPEPNLFRVQKWLARFVLADADVHPASGAYCRKKSILDCASQHCLCRWLIKIDVQQFFESISERQVYYAYRELGYEPLVAFELTRISTRLADHAPKRFRRNRWRNQWLQEDYAISKYWHGHVGHLPQGAPTSPMLSNLVMKRFDGRISKLAGQKGLVYTRYADDLTLSTPDPSFTRTQAELVIKDVFTELCREGLRPRTTKTVIAPPGARKIVLGLLVDRDEPRLTRQFRAKLDHHVYCLSHNGPVAHARARKFHSILGMKRHIAGLLNYAQQIDPEFTAPLFKKFEAVPWPF